MQFRARLKEAEGKSAYLVEVHKAYRELAPGQSRPLLETLPPLAAPVAALSWRRPRPASAPTASLPNPIAGKKESGARARAIGSTSIRAIEDTEPDGTVVLREGDAFLERLATYGDHFFAYKHCNLRGLGDLFQRVGMSRVTTYDHVRAPVCPSLGLNLLKTPPSRPPLSLLNPIPPLTPRSPQSPQPSSAPEPVWLYVSMLPMHVPLLCCPQWPPLYVEGRCVSVQADWFATALIEEAVERRRLAELAAHPPVPPVAPPPPPPPPPPAAPVVLDQAAFAASVTRAIHETSVEGELGRLRAAADLRNAPYVTAARVDAAYKRRVDLTTSCPVPDVCMNSHELFVLHF